MINTPLPWRWPPHSYQPELAVERYVADDGELNIRGCDGVIARCEDLLCEKFDQPRAVLLNSGTSALYAAFFAIDLRPGDEIIAPTVTFHATATPALSCFMIRSGGLLAGKKLTRPQLNFQMRMSTPTARSRYQRLPIRTMSQNLSRPSLGSNEFGMRFGILKCSTAVGDKWYRAS